MTDSASIFRFHWNPDLRLWFIRPDGADGEITASNVIMDAPCKSVGRELEVTAILKGNGLHAADSRGCVIDTAKFHRDAARPGVPPKVDPMKDWRFMFDNNGKKWAAYRADQQGTWVHTDNLTVDAYCESKGGEFVSHCEMIANGRTNIANVIPHADSVYLRKITVYPQVLNVSVIGAGTRANQP